MNIIAKRRKEVGLSQSQLASVVELSPKTIGNLEHNRIKLRYDNLERVAKALGIPMIKLKNLLWDES